MSAAKRRRGTAYSSGPALTWEDIDAAFDMLRGEYKVMWWYGEENSGVVYGCVAAGRLIDEIGGLIGEAADAMVADHYGLETLTGGLSTSGLHEEVSPRQFAPVSNAPHMDPELVWNISRAYWHEIVYRGMEIGRNEPFWITGIGEFSYDEVLAFTQRIWAAFKKVTGLDFTIPAESKLIKSWLGLSERYPGRDHAPDIHDDSLENKRSRLMHYIEHGGPSLKLMEKTGNLEPPPDDGFYSREYTTVGQQ